MSRFIRGRREEVERNTAVREKRRKSAREARERRELHGDSAMVGNLKPRRKKTQEEREQEEREDEEALEQVLIDAEEIRTDRKRKMSEKSLKYLKKKKIIKAEHFRLYAMETGEHVTYQAVIEHVNAKLLREFSTV